MVPNPIYDGPLYESVQPQFESLVSGVAAANNDHLHDDLQFESTTSLDSIAGKSRYVSSPGLIQSGSFSTYCNDDHSSTMEQQLPDDNGCCACTTSLNDNKMLQSKPMTKFNSFGHKVITITIN